MKGAGLRRGLVMLCCVAIVAGCATAPPGRSDNICLIFAEKADWFDDAARAAALTWALTRGARSGRVAHHFARHWVGQGALAARQTGG